MTVHEQKLIEATVKVALEEFLIELQKGGVLPEGKWDDEKTKQDVLDPTTKVTDGELSMLRQMARRNRSSLNQSD